MNFCSMSVWSGWPLMLKKIVDFGNRMTWPFWCLACCRDTLWESTCDGYSQGWSWNSYILREDRVPPKQSALSSYSLGQQYWGELFLLIACCTLRKSIDLLTFSCLYHLINKQESKNGVFHFEKGGE